MAHLEFAPDATEDFERILDHLLKSQVPDAASRLAEIASAVDVLSDNPLVGKPAKDGRRELVIGRGSRGYVVLYRYVVEIDKVYVLAIRSQREGGYARY